MWLAIATGPVVLQNENWLYFLRLRAVGLPFYNTLFIYSAERYPIHKYFTRRFNIPILFQSSSLRHYLFNPNSILTSKWYFILSIHFPFFNSLPKLLKRFSIYLFFQPKFIFTLFISFILIYLLFLFLHFSFIPSFKHYFLIHFINFIKRFQSLLTIYI
jgi:hypothetical protein